MKPTAGTFAAERLGARGRWARTSTGEGSERRHERMSGTGELRRHRNAGIGATAKRPASRTTIPAAGRRTSHSPTRRGAGRSSPPLSTDGTTRTAGRSSASIRTLGGSASRTARFGCWTSRAGKGRADRGPKGIFSGSSVGASRYFYTSKASTAEREIGVSAYCGSASSRSRHGVREDRWLLERRSTATTTRP